ncbi:MAG: HDOD domain-containing protein [Pseudomonadales bacterium]|nr:HDOD domain-containing protein [Pseudomonadales bacterium]
MTSAAELAQKSSQLFSLPDIYLKLSNMIKDESSTADQMAELIALDAGLSARLLKIANSSFYNFPAQIESITRAITLIGSNELSNLVLATSVASSFPNIDPNLVDMDSFWRHNVDTGLVMRFLGKNAQVRDAERLFVIGLLHNLGKLIVLTGIPEAARHILETAEKSSPWQQEQEVLGFTFAECGAELLKIWQLPETLVDAVRYQHEPQKAQVDPQAAALLHIASRAASWMEQETRNTEEFDYIQLIDPWVWGYTELSLEDMDEAIEFAQIEAWNLLGLISASLH